MSNVKLTLFQKEILEFFGKSFFGKNFYWTGGTLLSYHYLHHRNSVDLDFFSDDLYADDQYLIFINELRKKLGATKVSMNLQHNRRLYLINRKNESVKIELVFFPFTKLEKRKKLEEFSLKVDSLTDIMVNKTLSTYQRREAKDVYDLYYYLSRKPKYNLFKLIALTEKKFGLDIAPVLLLAKINELANDLDKIKPLLLIQRKDLSKKVKEFFQNNFNIIANKKFKSS